MTRLLEFVTAESGGVSVEWVSLTALIGLLGIAVVVAIFESGVSTAVTDVNIRANSAAPPNVRLAPTSPTLTNSN